MGVLRHSASLLRLRNGPLGNRQRATEVAEEACVPVRRGGRPGPQGRGWAIRQQRHGSLGGIDGRIEVAGVKPVTAEPFKQPRPVSRCRIARLGQGVSYPPRGTVRVSRPARGPRCLLQQGGARLRQPSG